MADRESGRYSAVIAALYLRGAPWRRCVPRARWGLVRDALLSLDPGLSGSAEALTSRGLWDEARALEEPGLLAWGWEQCESGRALTALDPGYPARWIEALGHRAPPAVWALGRVPLGPALSVVGNRRPEPAHVRFAEEVTVEALRLGAAVVSGGAVGIDSTAESAALAARGAGRVAVVLPCGVGRAELREGVCLLSAAEPTAPFSAGLAMERNALIYAWSPATVVVCARFRAGGAWAGATDALRRRLGRVLVPPWPGDRAASALIALGARPLAEPLGLAKALAEPEPPRLFEGVMEERAGLTAA
ncbi:MAG: DNA-processing protein DprA [Fimbriimonadaceae bacterium]|nr:DNA-processing protein DprA [Fimbriimonadaceae bacterium]QYK57583.1 MAG: DNA-processing protein DprA [Fimbriimonadaceae bacterium]